MKTLPTSLCVTVLALVAAVVSSAAAQLGDPAAALSIQEWIKGAKVDVQDGKRVYVVEFWATWCPPCRTSIPHLTGLQKRFKKDGVVVVGISDESPETVKPFVKKMGRKMDYSVACDDDRNTYAAYMKAFGQDGIPTAFVVGNGGKVLWFGHPMNGLDRVLEQIVEGKYDLRAAVHQDEIRALAQEYQDLVMAGSPRSKTRGRELLAKANNDPASLLDIAMTIAGRMRGSNRDFDLAHEALDRAETMLGKDDPKLLGVRAVVVFEAGNQQEGLDLAKRALALSKTPDEKSLHERFIRIMEMRMRR